MSVEARNTTRAAIFASMYNRRVVATTGPRMLLTYNLDGHPMGSELSLQAYPKLITRRHLTVHFHGTAPVDRIDFIRNNRVVHATPGNGVMDITLKWADSEHIDTTWMPAARHCDHPFTFYYIRVIQTDGEVAWASPVWIDPGP